jgi:hypothetical protein
MAASRPMKGRSQNRRSARQTNSTFAGQCGSSAPTTSPWRVGGVGEPHARPTPAHRPVQRSALEVGQAGDPAISGVVGGGVTAHRAVDPEYRREAAVRQQQEARRMVPSVGPASCSMSGWFRTRR